VPSLVWIIAATLVGAILGVLTAAHAPRARPGLVPILISYATGTLLGAVFLEVLPHALERSADAAVVMGTLLAGILLFFILEKLMLWRHRHDASLAGHHADRQRNHGGVATLVIVGDTSRNFVDGIIIAGAFSASIPLGVIIALALITHEMPQEIGDFLVLLRSGHSWRKALGFALLAGAVMVLGGVLGYYGLQAMPAGVPLLLSIAAGSMLYVSVADLIPGLVRRHELSATVQQVLLIVAGEGTIWVVGHLVRSFSEI
jgi:zinc and cadmium transporter